MIHTKSESDVTSLAPSSPSRSPKRPIYYVQSPSRDSHDEDNKSTSLHATPMFNSPMESPSHPSFGRHSRNSSASRFSGIFRSSSGRKGSRRRNNNDKGWPECNVIMEEGNYDDHKGLSRRMHALIALVCFVALFTVFCFIIWGASRPFKTQVTLKSLAVNNLYVAEATDFSGVPTRVITINATLKLGLYNPATFFGIHVASTPISLLYSRIVVATGQLQKHYQRRKSRSTIPITLIGDKVPLYGAGQNLEVSNVNGGKVPFLLEMELHSRGDVVGKLVTAKRRLHILCNVTVDYLSTKPIKFKKDSCTNH